MGLLLLQIGVALVGRLEMQKLCNFSEFTLENKGFDPEPVVVHPSGLQVVVHEPQLVPPVPVLYFHPVHLIPYVF